MQITITIDETNVQRLVNAFARTYGYQDQIPDPARPDTIIYIDNPMTKRQFFKQKVHEYIKSVVVNHELEEARKAVVVSEIDVT